MARLPAPQAALQSGVHMYRQLETNNENVLGFQFSGTITEEEAREILDQLSKLIRREKSVRLLVKLPEEPDPSALSTLNHRLRFFRDHAEYIERYALVTNKTLYKWASRAADVLIPMDVRPYELDHEEDAWRWLEASDEHSPADAQPLTPSR